MLTHVVESAQLPIFVSDDDDTLITDVTDQIFARCIEQTNVTGVQPIAIKDGVFLALVDVAVVVVIAGQGT